MGAPLTDIASMGQFLNSWFYANPTLIIEVIATQANFFQPSGYGTVIDCVFTFQIKMFVAVSKALGRSSNLQSISNRCTFIFFFYEMKRSFFQAAVVSILLYGCTTWTLRLEKKLDRNYTRMLRAILNKSCRQHPTRHQLYGHLPPITKTIQIRRTRPAGHCWRSRDELISDVLLWTPAYGRAKAGRSARTHLQQLCVDTGCSPENLLEAMNDREKWRERVRDIRACGTTWWWWWWWWRFYLCSFQITNGGKQCATCQRTNSLTSWLQSNTLSFTPTGTWLVFIQILCISMRLDDKQLAQPIPR